MNWFVIIGYYGYVNKSWEKKKVKEKKTELRRMKSIYWHIEWKLTRKNERTNEHERNRERAREEEIESDGWLAHRINSRRSYQLHHTLYTAAYIDKNELSWLVLLEFNSRNFIFYHRTFDANEIAICSSAKCNKSAHTELLFYSINVHVKNDIATWIFFCVRVCKCTQVVKRSNYAQTHTVTGSRLWFSQCIWRTSKWSDSASTDFHIN